jgi:hypothetical protein
MPTPGRAAPPGGTTTTGYRHRILPDAAARYSAGKLDSGRPDVLPASQDPPLRPPRDPA